MAELTKEEKRYPDGYILPKHEPEVKKLFGEVIEKIVPVAGGSLAIFLVKGTTDQETDLFIDHLEELAIQEEHQQPLTDEQEKSELLKLFEQASERFLELKADFEQFKEGIEGKLAAVIEYLALLTKLGYVKDIDTLRFEEELKDNPREVLQRLLKEAEEEEEKNPSSVPLKME